MAEHENQAARAKAIQAAIVEHRDEAQSENQHFTTPTDALIGEKLNAQRPLIVWQSWSPSVAVGKTLICDVGIANPAARPHANLFATLSVVPLPVDRVPNPPELQWAPRTADMRFPRLTLPRFDGLALEPGEVRSLRFAMTTPTSADRSNFFAQVLLLQAAWHSQGEHLDQSLLSFELV